MTNEQYNEAIIDRAVADRLAAAASQQQAPEQGLKLTVVDKVVFVVGAVALAACAYRAYTGDADTVLDDMWAGAKSGIKYGAVAGAVIGIGSGLIVGAPYNKSAQCAVAFGAGTAIAGAIYGSVLGGALNGSGVYDAFNDTSNFNTGINNDDLI